jgi:hypothetical protein
MSNNNKSKFGKNLEEVFANVDTERTGVFEITKDTNGEYIQRPAVYKEETTGVFDVRELRKFPEIPEEYKVAFTEHGVDFDVIADINIKKIDEAIRLLELASEALNDSYSIRELYPLSEFRTSISGIILKMLDKNFELHERRRSYKNLASK